MPSHRVAVLTVPIILERVLDNGFLVGVSETGDRFFYQNPLTSYGNYERFA